MEIDGVDSQSLGHAFLTPMDAERYIEELQKVSIEDFGDKKWMLQHERIEKLNLHAHHCAQKHLDNFVVDYLVTYDKVDTLIHNLLVVEAWKEFALPHVTDATVSKCSMRLYFMMYDEAVITNLLEITLFHQHVVESCDDAMLELVDYCMRKVTWLVTLSKDELKSIQNAVNVTDAKTFKVPTRREDLKRQKLELTFSCGVVAVGLLRYFAEHIEVLPLSVINRMLNTHDVIVALVPLGDSPPWTFRCDTGEWRKFVDHKWKSVPVEDLLLVTKTEAQFWIAMYYLLCSPSCRERYEFNSFRKAQLLRLRKYLNEVMIDQLPILADIQRYMDELSIMQTPHAASTSQSSSLVLEAIPVIREHLIKGKNWESFCIEQYEKIFSTISAEDNKIEMQRLADMYVMDGIDDLLGDEPSEVLKPTKIHVTLMIDGNDMSMADYKVAEDPYKSEKTASGLYKRYKVALLSPTSPQITIGETIFAKGTIELNDNDATVVQLGPDDLNIPMMDFNPVSPDVQTWEDIESSCSTTYPKALWRQIGCLKDQTGIIQVKLNRVPLTDALQKKSCYQIGTIFLSMPA